MSKITLRPQYFINCKELYWYGVLEAEGSANSPTQNPPICKSRGKIPTQFAQKCNQRAQFEESNSDQAINIIVMAGSCSYQTNLLTSLDVLDGDELPRLLVPHQSRNPKVARPNVAHKLVTIAVVHDRNVHSRPNRKRRPIHLLAITTPNGINCSSPEKTTLTSRGEGKKKRNLGQKKRLVEAMWREQNHWNRKIIQVSRAEQSTWKLTKPTALSSQHTNYLTPQNSSSVSFNQSAFLGFLKGGDQNSELVKT